MTAEGDIHLTSGDWVDLGLPSGLLWATRNVGASSPTDYGNYYAWGETSPKKVYDWNTYRHCLCNTDNGMCGHNNLTKYCNSSSYGHKGFTDNLTTLQSIDDAATVNYGGRTPTKEEWRELYYNTKSHWVTINGVKGRCFTGHNGNRIFLPAAGFRRGSSIHDEGCYGRYWSSLLYTDYPDRTWEDIYHEGCPSLAWNFYFGSGAVNVEDGWNIEYDRDGGFSVRAVR